MSDFDASEGELRRSETFTDYQRQRVKFDACLLRQNSRAEFVACRVAKARATFDEFRAQAADFFRYVDTVAMRADELIVKSEFYDDEPEWVSTWKVDRGPCVTGGPKRRKFYNLTDVQADKFDYILVRTNAFEATRDTKFLAYFAQNGHRSNLLELVAGQNLEVAVRGFSEISKADCIDNYPRGCVPENFIYTTQACKWCAPKVRDACACANPDLHQPAATRKFARNCSLLELTRCGAAQMRHYHSAACDNACQSVEYSIGYSARPLTLEMLNVSIGELEDVYVAEHQRTMDKLFEFRALQPLTTDDSGARPAATNAPQSAGIDAPIWQARKELQTLLDDFFAFTLTLLRIVYGAAYNMPILFEEDLIYGQASRYRNWSIGRLVDHCTLRPELLAKCGAADGSKFATALHEFAAHFFAALKGPTFHELFDCPTSISRENCRRLLNGTWKEADLEELQAVSGIGSYLHLSLGLAITLNASALNPFGIIQYYSNSTTATILAQRMDGLRDAALNVFAAALSDTGALDAKCRAEKLELLQQLFSSPLLFSSKNGSLAVDASQSNWMRQFAKFLRKYKSMHLLDDYLRSNYALLTINYQGLVEERIVYRYDYSFWEFLSDVGGILGLYFGLTIVTVYEMVVFLAIDKEPPEPQPPVQHKFTKKMLYKPDKAILNDQAVPTLF